MCRPSPIYRWTHAQRVGVPAVVSLLGGIGDHLEMISMLLEWSRIDTHPLILQVTPQRQQALAPLIESIPTLHCKAKFIRERSKVWR